MLGLTELGILILLVQLGEGDGASVYGSGHAGRGGAVAGCRHQQQKRGEEDATHGAEVPF
jgi:hypothetical protein